MTTQTLVREKVEFIVFRISVNRNSFGLTGMWLMDREGRMWSVGASDLNKKKMNEVISVTCISNREVNQYKEPNWAEKGFEIPKRSDSTDAPQEIIDQVWGSPKARLEYLRGEIEAERISYGEIAELQSLASHIEAGDVLLLEWAGVPEFPEE